MRELPLERYSLHHQNTDDTVEVNLGARDFLFKTHHSNFAIRVGVVLQRALE